MRPGRWSAAALAATLAACSVNRDYAESRRVLVDVGMSGEEVRRAVGAPTRIVEVPSVPGVAEQTVRVWQYDVDRIPDASVILDLVLAAGALVLIGAMVAGGGGSGLGGVKVGGGGGGGTRYRFWVGFGADGRVRGVTNLEKVR
jgi:hypothetical protein